MARWLRDFWRSLQGSAAHGRALKLKRRGRVSEARDVLLGAVRRLGSSQPGEDTPLQVNRIFLIWMLGETAEQLGDNELARRSYEEFLALASRVPVAPGHRGEHQKIEMEEWARQALVRLRRSET